MNTYSMNLTLKNHKHRYTDTKAPHCQLFHCARAVPICIFKTPHARMRLIITRLNFWGMPTCAQFYVLTPLTVTNFLFLFAQFSLFYVGATLRYIIIITRFYDNPTLGAIFRIRLRNVRTDLRLR